ncbi:MAG: helix-turn-helix domain-containing protein [Saccharofermentans sp.]|jgi:hypothetical protein|nr:helix-turn-helix domain-containing protein [Mageeibacillus sp.]MCI1264397.1 helix-turn-helix domain-containing protein [Saccharofermentans sp.]MCI1275092.1 helix-turn-helix domain-containing protein [Saccharofermentans sp.]MCI1769533.1 helix-turn-helix domain-containing protein [Mageeibacillus sp.]MCI2044378.1 helix-turn-helix domain-containing protein [Mageeibacillus sp.]
MGRQSTKENKNIYFLCREDAGLTREAAAGLMPGMGPDRIEKIESEKCVPRPEDILLMADAYKRPELLNMYCSGACPIGRRTVIPINPRDLSQIALSMLKSLNELDERKNRLIDIAIDNRIDDGELPEFVAIKDALADIAVTSNTMQLWVDTMIANKKISEEEMDQVRRKRLS